MGFSDLTSPAGLKALSDYLADKSYIEGVEPSQADVVCYKGTEKKPDAEKYPNAARWYNHIDSLKSKFDELPGDKTKHFSAYGSTAAIAVAVDEDKDADDDVDLFGSDDEVDEEAEKLKAQRLEEYRKKKAAKGPGPAAKSIVTIDIKPWDDETNLDEMLTEVKNISMDGLVWGGHQFIPIGYGIKKLQINCVVEDAKVSMDELQEQIAEIEDYVQSSDVAAMQKL